MDDNHMEMTKNLLLQLKALARKKGLGEPLAKKYAKPVMKIEESMEEMAPPPATPEKETDEDEVAKLLEMLGGK